MSGALAESELIGIDVLLGALQIHTPSRRHAAFFVGKQLYDSRHGLPLIRYEFGAPGFFARKSADGFLLGHC